MIVGWRREERRRRREGRGTCGGRRFGVRAGK